MTERKAKLKRFMEHAFQIEDEFELALYWVNVVGRKIPLWRSKASKLHVHDRINDIMDCYQEHLAHSDTTMRFVLRAIALHDEDRNHGFFEMSWSGEPPEAPKADVCPTCHQQI